MKEIEIIDLDLQSRAIQELRRRLDIYITEFHREHGLINNRITWYVTSQSFLAIALASAGQRNNRVGWLIYVIPLVGLFLSALTLITILAALSVQETLKKKKDELIGRFFEKNKYNDEQRAIIIEPWGIRSLKIQKYGMIAPKYIPQVIIVFWAVTLFLIFLLKTK